jgi:predicted nucleic acid-binding protein
MYLIDTNVLSEYRKGSRADAGVRKFFATTESGTLFLPVQVIGEIQAGIAKLRRDGDQLSMQRADTYDAWLERVIIDYGDHIIQLDIDAARIWGTLLPNNKKDPHTIDKQIAAIALEHNLVVVTRDKGAAFSHTPNLQVLNPFNDHPHA